MLIIGETGRGWEGQIHGNPLYFCSVFCKPKTDLKKELLIKIKRKEERGKEGIKEEINKGKTRKKDMKS